MCGIFLIKYNLKYNNKPNLKADIKNCYKHLGRRGRDASGILLIFEEKLAIIKSNSESSDLLKSNLFNKELFKFSTLFKGKKFGEIFVIGHTRMITHGDPDNKENQMGILYNEWLNNRNTHSSSISDVNSEYFNRTKERL